MSKRIPIWEVLNELKRNSISKNIQVKRALIPCLILVFMMAPLLSIQPTVLAKPANLSIASSTQTFIAGTNNQVNFTITNLGDFFATEIFVSLSLPSSATVGALMILNGSDGKYYIDHLGPNQSYTISANIYVSPSAAGGSYSLTFTMSYQSDGSKTDTRIIGVIVPLLNGPSATIDVLLSTSDLVSGSLNNLNITVMNNGDAPADAVSVSITTSGVQGGSTSIALINSDGTYTLGRMVPGEKRTIPIMLFVNPSASGTITSLTVTTSYTDMGYKLMQQVNYLGMVVRGNVNLVILDTSTYPSNITLGSPFTLTVSMINLGTVSAESAIIMPNGTAEIQPISSNKVFLGDLAVNVPSSFTIPFIASNIVSGNYNLTLAYSYKDSLGSSFVNYLYIPFTLTVASNATTSGQGAQGSLLGTLFAWLPYIMIAIAIIIVLYLLLRRRSRSGQ